tara:strand:- start:20 stop:454 length:435 start_codon:yes stop_codon:yes gene_type:complete
MQNEVIPAAPDRVTALAEKTVHLARLADKAIGDVILPALHPARRLGAERALRLIAGRQMFRDEIYDEIEALIRVVEKEVAAGSRQVFRPHESDPNHGHIETVRDDRCEALANAAETLRCFSSAIAETVDAVEAQKIIARAFAVD